MKLKILFFPIAVVVAMWAAIWVIKPEIIDIQNNQKNLETRNTELLNVKEKQKTINSLISNLDANSDKVKIVNDYMPATRDEEEIINKVYQRAVDAKVTLDKLSVSDSRGKDKVAGIQTGGQALLEDEGVNPIKLNFIKAEVMVTGTYENLRTFFNYIHTMEKVNSVNSVKVGESESVGDQDGGPAKPKAKGELSATMDVDFNFFSPVEVQKSANLSVFSQPEFDFSVADKVKKLLAEKVADVTVGETGKKNPFTP